jgi:hypothetical protein
VWEGKPLKGETLDVVVGRNKPTRSVAEQTVEGVRNAEDGKAAGFGKPDAKTLLIDTARRDRPTPRKELRATKATGRIWDGRL